MKAFKAISKSDKDFLNVHLKYEGLTHLSSLLIIINITVFVATGLVQGFTYYFPLIALVLFFLLHLITIFPKTDLLNKKVYWTCFSLLIIGGYFTVASIIYYVQHGHYKALG